MTTIAAAGRFAPIGVFVDGSIVGLVGRAFNLTNIGSRFVSARSGCSVERNVRTRRGLTIHMDNFGNFSVCQRRPIVKRGTCWGKMTNFFGEIRKVEIYAHSIVTFWDSRRWLVSSESRLFIVAYYGVIFLWWYFYESFLLQRSCWQPLIHVTDMYQKLGNLNTAFDLAIFAHLPQKRCFGNTFKSHNRMPPKYMMLIVASRRSITLVRIRINALKCNSCSLTSSLESFLAPYIYTSWIQNSLYIRCCDAKSNIFECFQC